MTSRAADPPGAEHPDPVVPVHGLTASRSTNWQTVSPLLANDGHCVFALTYGVPGNAPYPQDQIGGLTRMEDSAVELDAPNATNIVVQDGCEIDLSDHVSIISTRRTGQLVRNALDPAHAEPPPCDAALPAAGNEVLPCG